MVLLREWRSAPADFEKQKKKSADNQHLCCFSLIILQRKSVCALMFLFTNCQDFMRRCGFLSRSAVSSGVNV